MLRSPTDGVRIDDLVLGIDENFPSFVFALLDGQKAEIQRCVALSSNLNEQDSQGSSPMLHICIMAKEY